MVIGVDADKADAETNSGILGLGIVAGAPTALLSSRSGLSRSLPRKPRKLEASGSPLRPFTTYRSYVTRLPF
jgi:hypothetical protein